MQEIYNTSFQESKETAQTAEIEIPDPQLDSKTSFYWPIYRKCCSDHSKENRPKSPEKKRKNLKNFYTLYKVFMLISPSSSSKTNVRTTLGLRPMQNPPKVPGGEERGGCEEGGDVTRLGVTVDGGNS